jgi:hypothetical protein
MNHWKPFWHNHPYPCTIFADRYGGTYSGGAWTAWNLEPKDIPADASGSDNDCADFWDENTEPVGFGNTPAEALADLIKKLKEEA